MHTDRRPRPASGFSLVELLVVIGIIALLLAILMPVLGRARRQARVVACGANVRSLAQACNTYALQNAGEFPTLAISSGGNLWDVPHEFYRSLRKQGLPHEAFFCPAADNYDEAQAEFTRYSTFYMIDYNIWIPRLNGGNGLIPPSVTGSTPYTFPSPKPTKQIMGPANLADRLAPVNPIITDRVGTGAAGSPNPVPPADANVGVDDHPYNLNSFSNHKVGQRVVDMNAGFADGHVETLNGKTLRPRYYGNRWNWR
ncbi:MAG TPA: type II secretion system protein [Humisphaera sp.]